MNRPKRNSKKNIALIPQEDPSPMRDVPSSEGLNHSFILSVLALVISASSLFLCSYMSAKQTLVTVDMTQLLHTKATSIVGSTKNKEDQRGSSEQALQLAKEAQNIRKTIENYADAHQVVVVAKGAVFSTLVHDITGEIDALLRK